MEPLRVVGIYNADGHVRGELRYVFDKIRGRADCGLCDLTHGWSVFGKRSWREACRTAAVPIEFIHRDKATKEQLTAAGPLPAVVAGKDGKWWRLANREVIRSMSKNPTRFLAYLQEQLLDGQEST